MLFSNFADSDPIVNPGGYRIVLKQEHCKTHNENGSSIFKQTHKLKNTHRNCYVKLSPIRYSWNGIGDMTTKFDFIIDFWLI